jgi:hypothetical protein
MQSENSGGRRGFKSCGKRPDFKQGRLNYIPQGLKPLIFNALNYGLKPVPINDSKAIALCIVHPALDSCEKQE